MDLLFFFFFDNFNCNELYKLTSLVMNFRPNNHLAILAENQPKEQNLKLHKLTINVFVPLNVFESLTFIIFTNPYALAGYDTRAIFKRSLTGLNSEFSFSLTSCLTKAEEPSLPYYLLIAGGRLIGFIPFPRVLVLCEMQSASSRI